MQQKWMNFSEEEIRDIVQQSSTMTEVMTKLGYNAHSSSSRNRVRDMLDEKNIDYSKFSCTRKTDTTTIKSQLTLKQLLIKQRGYKCERCNNSEWMGQPIPLELHHVNGNHSDNQEDNLILLCPNCHALTDNWKGKNHKTSKISDEEFYQALMDTDNIHQACLKLGITPCQSAYMRARKLLNSQT